MDVATLADLLRETAEHHDPYEKAAPPHDWWDWWDWYAPYLSAREQGRRHPTPPGSIWKKSEMFLLDDFVRPAALI